MDEQRRTLKRPWLFFDYVVESDSEDAHVQFSDEEEWHPIVTQKRRVEPDRASAEQRVSKTKNNGNFLAAVSQDGFSTNIGKNPRKNKEKVLTDQNDEKTRGQELTEYFRQFDGWKYVSYPVFTLVFKQFQDGQIEGFKRDDCLSFYFEQTWNGMWSLLLP